MARRIVFGFLAIAVLALTSCHSALRRTTDDVCRHEELPPWVRDFTPKGAGQVLFADLHDTPLEILRQDAPVPARVCTAGGPTNAFRANLKLRDGRTMSVAVRDASCTEFAVPGITLKPGCVSTNKICDLIQKKWRCKQPHPDHSVKIAPFWSRGWAVVAPYPRDSDILKGNGRVKIYFAPNPERTIPSAYLMVSDDVRTVYACGDALVHIDDSDPAGPGTRTAKLNGCSYLTGKAMWVLPEEVIGEFTVINYRVIW